VGMSDSTNSDNRLAQLERLTGRLSAQMEMLLARSRPAPFTLQSGTPVKGDVPPEPGKIAHVKRSSESGIVFGIAVIVAPTPAGATGPGRYLGCFYLDPGYHRIHPSQIPDTTKTQAEVLQGWNGDWSTVGIELCGAADPSASWPAAEQTD